MLTAPTRWRCLPVQLPRRRQREGPGRQEPLVPTHHSQLLNLCPVLCLGQKFVARR